MLALLAYLLIAAVILWGVSRIVPLLPPPISTIVYVVVVVLVAIWIINLLFALIGSGPILRLRV